MSKNVPQTTQKGQTPQEALMTAFKKDMDSITPYLEKLLPHKGQVGRFTQMTLVAILRDPTLLYQNRRSLLLALLYCAYKDLEPGVEDGCWLLPFKKIVTPIPAYKGLIKKAVETETAQDVQPYGIYQHDDFEFGLGVDPFIIHKPPKLGADRGELIGAYVVITKPDGVKRFHVMDRTAIEKIRAVSASYQAAPDKSPWTLWEEAMFLKTVIKQGFKYLPVKPAFRDLLVDDGRIEAGEAVAALLHESGEELPEGLVGEEPPPAEPEPTDTSEFDKLVNEKLNSPDATSYPGGSHIRRRHVEEFVKEIAASNKKVKVTPEQVKANAATKFDPYPDPQDNKKTAPGFWNTFLAWEAKKYPPPPEKTAAAAPLEDAGAGQAPSSGPATGPGEECPFPAAATGSGEAPPTEGPAPAASSTPSGEDPTFAGKRLALWDAIIDKKALDGVATKLGVQKTADITPENFEDIKWLVANYQPPKKGRK